MTPREYEALKLLEKGEQPSNVARITGLSQVWIEIKARALGIKPLSVEGMK
jgi:hypothetical protein